MSEKHTYPVVDLHCDLTHYLATVEGARPDDTDGIGCAIPHLKQGNVMVQVMAISSIEKPPSHAISSSQIEWYQKLSSDYGHILEPVTENAAVSPNKVGMLPAIENASVLCGPDDPLDNVFEMLERIFRQIGRPLYISLTHHAENRFGGGNMSDVGLKDDGRRLLEYINGKRIAVDLSHTSDALAHDIIDHIDAKNLTMPIMASHSNFREVHDHPRNLPDDLAREIIVRKGVIGINFARSFVNPEDPEYLTRHFIYGLDLGGAEAIAIGADYFHAYHHLNPAWLPFFFEQHENAGKYPAILDGLARQLDTGTVEAIASGNALRFLNQFYYTV